MRNKPEGARESKDYEGIYRKMNPRIFPYSAHERQKELSDLWPADQERFKDQVDSIASAIR